VYTKGNSGKEFKKLIKGLTAAGTAPEFPVIGSTGFSFNSTTRYCRLETKIDVKIQNTDKKSDVFTQIFEIYFCNYR